MQYHLGTPQQQQQQQLGMKAVSQTMVASGSATPAGGYRYPTTQAATPESASKPEPPKKPLTPYMMFSKSIWPQVKAANSHLSSVCEIGAVVGALWRDLNPVEKQKYNIQFNRDKERYDLELRTYLKTTGLLASDLVKPRARRRDVKPTTPLRSHVSPGLRTTQQSSGAVGVAHDPGHGSNQLVFSQTWTPQQQQQLLAQMGLSAGVGQAVFANADGTLSNSAVASLLTGTGGRGDTRAATNGPVDTSAQFQETKAAKEQIALLQAEVAHLRDSVAEKDCEVIRLNSALEDALNAIEIYKQATGEVQYQSGQEGTHEDTIERTAGVAEDVHHQQYVDQYGRLHEHAEGTAVETAEDQGGVAEGHYEAMEEAHEEGAEGDTEQYNDMQGGGAPELRLEHDQSEQSVAEHVDQSQHEIFTNPGLERDDDIFKPAAADQEHGGGENPTIHGNG